MAIINIVVSIIAAKAVGIAGIFFGTIVSYLVTQFWINPYVLCKYRFHVSFKKWICFFSIRIGVVLAAFFATSFIVRLTNIFLLQVCICLVVPNILFVIALMKTKEFCYIKTKISEVVKKGK